MDTGSWLQLGSQGPRVTTLQLKLTALKYNVGTADGHFGPKTLEGVKAFQKAKGLSVDGVVGPKTASALGIDLSAPVHSVSRPPQHTADSPASGSKSPALSNTQTGNLFKNQAKQLVQKFASSWSTDEEGLANALFARGKDANLVMAAFKVLEEEYENDSDDVAVAYVELVMQRRGEPLEMLKQNSTLRELLIHLLYAGVTCADEDKAIQFLRDLAGGSDSGTTSAVEAMVQAALKQEGKSYVFGAEVKASEKNAKAFDCSELVEWAVAQAGGYIPDGSQAQREWCRKHKTTLPVDKAIQTRGALLFTDSHVAISLGNGKTIEAANKNKGVCSLNAAGRGWKEAGLVPGLGQGSSTGTTTQKSPSKTQTTTTTKTDKKTTSEKTAMTSTSDAGDVINGHVIYPNEVRAGGTLAWRNNNPGNIRNGRFTDSHGAFKGKKNRGFAIFPDHATGFAALIALLKTDSYRPLSVTEAMKRYAPASDNNDPAAYAQNVSKMTGLDVRKTLGSLTDTELKKFATAIQRVEGWTAGTVYSRTDPKLAQMGIHLSNGTGSTTKVTTTPTASNTTTGKKVVTGGAGRAAQQLGANTQRPSEDKKKQVSGTATGKVTLPAGAHAETLKKLGQQARKRMNRNNEGRCAAGVCEMLGAAGYLYGNARPLVASGIIQQVYDYGTGKWIDSSTRGYYVPNHSCLDNTTHAVKKGSEGKVRSAAASESAKFMRHTLKMFKFAECTPFLRGHGSRGTPPAESVNALRTLPEGTVVVFGPALSRSVLKAAGKPYTVGGSGHAGHIGILVREGQEVLVVADGLLSAGGKYTVELCLSNYAWAVGFVPTTEPLKLTQKDRPAKSL